MRVVIAEDLFLLRDGLTRMLQAHGLEISAAVDNGADLLAAEISRPWAWSIRVRPSLSRKRSSAMTTRTGSPW